MPFFLNGLIEAVQLAYGANRTVRAQACSCADALRLRRAPHNCLFQYTGGTVTAAANVAACR